MNGVPMVDCDCEGGVLVDQMYTVRCGVNVRGCEIGSRRRQTLTRKMQLQACKMATLAFAKAYRALEQWDR